MKPDVKAKVLGQVSDLIKKSESAITSGRGDTEAMSDASPSAKGDLLNTRSQQKLSEQRLEALKKLSDEIQTASDEIPSRVETPSLVNLQLGSDDMEILFAKNSATVEGIAVVTSNSPLGKAIDGKTPGETFSYTHQGTTNTGRINVIE